MKPILQIVADVHEAAAVMVSNPRRAQETAVLLYRMGYEDALADAKEASAKMLGRIADGRS